MVCPSPAGRHRHYSREMHCIMGRAWAKRSIMCIILVTSLSMFNRFSSMHQWRSRWSMLICHSLSSLCWAHSDSSLSLLACRSACLCPYSSSCAPISVSESCRFFFCSTALPFFRLFQTNGELIFSLTFFEVVSLSCHWLIQTKSH